MKRCPECGREYDSTMSFCLDDGAELLYGPASAGESATVILSEPGAPAIQFPSEEGPTAVIRTSSASNVNTPNSIAVLPFVNMSADADNEYFCDGLAEELLNALTKIDDLKVAARTASFSFRGKNESMAEIGRALNVNSILEGSVRKAGNRVRITVQLINAADGYHIWSERYDRDMQHIFEIQDEITLSVVDSLKLTLLGNEKQAVLKRHTENSEAYQNYLRGRFFFFKRTPEGFTRAVEYFQKAIDLDPRYALAYSGLADSHVFFGFYEMVTPADAEKHARPNALRSVELDPSLGETNISLALLRSLFDWEFRASLECYERAIVADPNYAFSFHLQSAILVVLGDFEASFEAEKHAIELDPFTPVFNASLGWWYYLARQNEEAMAQCKRTLEIAPNHFFAYWVQGLAYAVQESYVDSVVSLQKALALNQFDQHIRADLGRVFGLMGEREAATSILKELDDLSKQQYISPVNLAKVYVGIGEKENGMSQLERAVEERSIKLPYLLLDPAVDSLRDDPRFASVRRRAGLPDITP